MQKFLLFLHFIATYKWRLLILIRPRWEQPFIKVSVKLKSSSIYFVRGTVSVQETLQHDLVMSPTLNDQHCCRTDDWPDVIREAAENENNHTKTNAQSPISATKAPALPSKASDIFTVPIQSYVCFCYWKIAVLMICSGLYKYKEIFCLYFSERIRGSDSSINLTKCLSKHWLRQSLVWGARRPPGSCWMKTSSH